MMERLRKLGNIFTTLNARVMRQTIEGLRKVGNLFTILSVASSKRLAKATSFGYIILYVLIMFVFALMYAYWIPTHFYHSTAKYEAYLNKNADRLMTKLKDALVEYTIDKEKGSSIKTIPVDAPRILDAVPVPEAMPPAAVRLDSNSEAPHIIETMHTDRQEAKAGFEINSKDVEFSRLKVELEDIILSVSQPTTLMPSGEIVNYDYMIHFCISCSRAHYGTTDHEAKSGNHEDLSIHVENPFSYPSIFPYTPKYGYQLRISKDLGEELVNFVSTVNGFPAQSEGRFWRMFYLSATTITTLGFGDIVPLTGCARALVGIEAVLGVAIFGLFLNALGHEIYSHSNDKSVLKIDPRNQR